MEGKENQTVEGMIGQATKGKRSRATRGKRSGAARGKASQATEVASQIKQQKQVRSGKVNQGQEKQRKSIQAHGAADPGRGGPWELWTLGAADPGSGGP